MYLQVHFFSGTPVLIGTNLTIKLLLSISIVYYGYKKTQKGKVMESTTIKVRKTTVALLKQIAAERERRESLEQVILELIERFNNGKK